MPKKFPPEFKRDVVAVAGRGKIPVSEVDADFDVSESTLWRWMQQADVDDGIKGGLTAAEHDELDQLRRGAGRLEQENELLRRAAVYFVRDLG